MSGGEEEQERIGQSKRGDLYQMEVRVCTLNVSQPLRLLVMFRGDGQRVEEDQEDDQPVENLGFHGRSAFPPTQSVPPPRVATETTESVGRQREERWEGRGVRGWRGKQPTGKRKKSERGRKGKRRLVGLESSDDITPGRRLPVFGAVEQS